MGQQTRQTWTTWRLDVVLPRLRWVGSDALTQNSGKRLSKPGTSGVPRADRLHIPHHIDVVIHAERAPTKHGLHLNEHISQKANNSKLQIHLHGLWSNIPIISEIDYNNNNNQSTKQELKATFVSRHWCFKFTFSNTYGLYIRANGNAGSTNIQVLVFWSAYSFGLILKLCNWFIVVYMIVAPCTVLFIQF